MLIYDCWNPNIIDNKGYIEPYDWVDDHPPLGKQTVFLTMAHVALSQF